MGHCGNSFGSYEQRILSLRREAGNGKWVPHLTFVLEPNGYLGQMKGRGNDKPAPKYYPYIVKLLENPIIKGIQGGGYEPDTNFSLSDLPKDEYTRLIEKKPELLPKWTTYFEKDGLDSYLLKEMQEWSGTEIKKFKNTDKVIILKFKDFGELVDNHGNETAKEVAAFLYDNLLLSEDVERYVDEDTESELLNYIQNEQPEVYKQILSGLRSTYPQELKKWKKDEEYDTSDSDHVYYFAASVGSPLIGDLHHGCVHGIIAGVQESLVEDLIAIIKDDNLFAEYPDYFIQSPIYLLASSIDVTKAMDEKADYKEFLKNRIPEIDLSSDMLEFDTSEINNQVAFDSFTDVFEKV